MNRTESKLLGPFNGRPTRRDDDLRRVGELNSRWRTCLVPPDARAVIAEAIATAYDAGFWHGTAEPIAPAYAQALAAAAYDRGRFDAIITRAPVS